MDTVVRLRPSQSEKPTVRGGRAKNADYRQREYLTEAEIDKLMAAAGESRNPARDRLLILMAFRHATRVSELVDLRWQQVHLDGATVDIRRAKNGTPGIHGLLLPLTPGRDDVRFRCFCWSACGPGTRPRALLTLAQDDHTWTVVAFFALAAQLNDCEIILPVYFLLVPNLL
jgi:hypothetical protein